MDLIGVAGVLVTLAGMGVGGIVWLVRLEGRINTETELRKALSDRVTGLEERIVAQLDRIESRLDSVLRGGA